MKNSGKRASGCRKIERLGLGAVDVHDSCCSDQDKFVCGGCRQRCVY